MPRPKRNFIPGHLYDIWQAGNKLYPLYLDAEDLSKALRLLHTCSLRYGVRIHAHQYDEHQGAWLMEPASPHAISELMRDMQSQYSRYLNRKYGHRPYCSRESNRKAGRRSIRTSTNLTPRYGSKEARAVDTSDSAAGSVECPPQHWNVRHRPAPRTQESGQQKIPASCSQVTKVFARDRRLQRARLGQTRSTISRFRTVKLVVRAGPNRRAKPPPWSRRK